MRHVFLTGAAGFVGYHCVRALLDADYKVTAIDNLNAYYDVALKKDRLAKIENDENFNFIEGDIADHETLNNLADKNPDIEVILHLAAQAGVRYSLENPYSYGHSNLTGQLAVLELARRLHTQGDLKHCVYASSSSVYGGNTDYPFSIQDRVDNPVSLYAATKKSGEMLAQSYANLYGIPLTGLRFFTVYGPWGRPDMAYFLFTKALYEAKTLTLYNNGDMGRDFTYIDDVVSGVQAALDLPPKAGDRGSCYGATHRIFNLGNNKPVRLSEFLSILEELTGKNARIEYQPMQAGDVKETYADIDLSRDLLDFCPETPLRKGLEVFVGWYKAYYKR